MLTNPTFSSSTTTSLSQAVAERILILDGAMGTMIQRLNLTETDFRGDILASHSINLRGCNDVLCLTNPEAIAGVHRQYLRAGADIIETDTFNANTISLAEYGLAELAGRINEAGASLACRARDDWEKESGKHCYVAGSMGPTNISLSLGEGNVDFQTLVEAYRLQAEALISGGVDALLLETIFDTLNAKAAIAGIHRAMDSTKREIPLMISVTLTEQGRTLSGQTLRAFVNSVAHANPFSIGLNCGFGPDALIPFLETLREVPYAVSIYPNAGLPDEMGQYRETPEKMASELRIAFEKGLVNIVGGCCGTTPDHIRAIAREASAFKPREIPGLPISDSMDLAGNAPLRISHSKGFVKVGERCNVAGSRKFLRLINERNYDEALKIASAQIEKGAEILDINMDDGLLDAPREMARFVEMLTSSLDTADLPLMIDSSTMDVIMPALEKIQGRPLVNSISLKEGEENFIGNARKIKDMGGLPVVMAFDEKGQATDLQRRKEILSRAYRLLTEKVGFRGCEIVFDPNILTIATGIAEHNRYALDFIECVAWIKENLPGAKVSGGVSNLSFAFRGHNKVREALHTVFLHHAIADGLDMAIVNPSTSIDIATVDPELAQIAEDLIFARNPEEATARMMEKAMQIKAEAEAKKAVSLNSTTQQKEKSQHPHYSDGLEALIKNGHDSHLEDLLLKALEEEGSAMGVVKNRLMKGMEIVGEDFGAGRMFLPQVVRSAAVMQKAVDFLTPYIEKESSQKSGNSENSDNPDNSRKIVLATVKGDVHDIGKNIVAVVMRCAGFEVIDLGVMVTQEKIIETLKSSGSKFLGLSGLITPSLAEMAKMMECLENEGMTDVKVFVGGATTSALHTAVKLAPLYSGDVVHTLDAAALPLAVAAISDPTRNREFSENNKRSQEKLREEYAARQNASDASVESENRPSAKSISGVMPPKCGCGKFDFHFSLDEVIPLINWKAFLHTWRLSPKFSSILSSPQSYKMDETSSLEAQEARKLLGDARKLLDELENEGVGTQGRALLVHAHSDGDDIIIDAQGETIVIPTIRQKGSNGMATSDFVAEKDDYIGLFAVTAREICNFHAGNSHCGCGKDCDHYSDLLLQTLADRLVEASTELLHRKIHDLWGVPDSIPGIRPAFGYPSLPDQTLVNLVDPLMDYSSIGVEITENGALRPHATTTGLLLFSPEAKYFNITEISAEMKTDYARRRGLDPKRIEELLISK